MLRLHRPRLACGRRSRSTFLRSVSLCVSLCLCLCTQDTSSTQTQQPHSEHTTNTRCTSPSLCLTLCPSLSLSLSACLSVSPLSLSSLFSLEFLFSLPSARACVVCVCECFCRTACLASSSLGDELVVRTKLGYATTIFGPYEDWSNTLFPVSVTATLTGYKEFTYLSNVALVGFSSFSCFARAQFDIHVFPSVVFPLFWATCVCPSFLSCLPVLCLIGCRDHWSSAAASRFVTLSCARVVLFLSFKYKHVP